jgi:hypothetical protein
MSQQFAVGDRVKVSTKSNPAADARGITDEQWTAMYGQPATVVEDDGSADEVLGKDGEKAFAAEAGSELIMIQLDSPPAGLEGPLPLTSAEVERA